VSENVFIGIGSNIGNGIKNCMTAIKKISGDDRVDLKSISSFYSTSPVSEIKQDDFINCAILVGWKGTPNELLEFLMNVENNMGRTREIKDGPRIIDLDILLFDDMVRDEPSLTIPHKELHKRRFALMPCLEIDPNYILPTHKRPLIDFLPEIDEDQIVTKLQGLAFLEEFEEE
jgi:dihydroneopterin aldolase / 2-amino-4-hydroxy-6-hydroxymethyldihydropteridine diphosphokinase